MLLINTTLNSSFLINYEDYFLVNNNLKKPCKPDILTTEDLININTIKFSFRYLFILFTVPPLTLHNIKYFLEHMFF